MRYILFPDEERSLLRHLHGELGLRYITRSGSSDLAARISDDFPNLMSNEEREFVFWCSEIGPIRRLGDAPPPRDAKEGACLQLNREADPKGWKDQIDLSRTPVLSWRRPLWYRPDRTCLVAGRLGSMTAKIKDHPVELRRVYRRVDTWLRKPAMKFNPFKHCSNAPVAEPKNLSAFWVAAWPQGREWIEQGGELWPWDA